jgi:hypothetical protein
LIVGGVLTAVGLLFPNPILGCWARPSPSLLPYARDYARYIFIGAPLFAGSFVLNNALRAEGNAVLSLVGISNGAVINIALDPLFIFTLGFGTGGAAIATVLSQAIGFCILGSHYVTGLAVLRLKPAFATFHGRGSCAKSCGSAPPRLAAGHGERRDGGAQHRRGRLQRCGHRRDDHHQPVSMLDTPRSSGSARASSRWSGTTSARAGWTA